MSELLPPIHLPEICVKFPCAVEAKDLIAGCSSPAAFIAQLQAQSMSVDAVRSLARCMPKEKAVEWAVASARMAGEKAGLTSEEETALNAAKSWFEEPSAFTSAAAKEAAANLPPDSPAYWAANAAAYADGIEAPEEVLLQVGADDLTAQFAAGSVMLSAAKLSPAGIPEKFGEAPPVDLVQVDALIIDSVAQWVEAPQPPELTPAQQAESGPYLAPFIEKGIKIAQSVPGWS